MWTVKNIILFSGLKYNSRECISLCFCCENTVKNSHFFKRKGDSLKSPLIPEFRACEG